MKTIIRFLLSSVLLSINCNLYSQITTFTYQGHLNYGANPANGLYDFQFEVYDALSGGNSIGNLSLTTPFVTVSNGLFTVPLDFGPGIFSGPNRWLNIAVRTNGATSFINLTPRQALTPAPYSIYATVAGVAGSANSVAAANIAGTVPLAKLPNVILTNGASGLSIAGNFSGSGAGLTNLSVTLDSVNSFGTISRMANFISSFALGAGSGPSSIMGVDVNGDGKKDLVVANLNDNTLSVFINNGISSFLRTDYAVGIGPYGLAAADINGDGKVDIICANSATNTITVLTNNGSGGLATATSPVVGTNPWSVVATDVNGDGKLDLACANYGADTVSVLINNGTGGFVLSAPQPVGSHPSSIIAEDVNGDGKVDLVCANLYDSTLSVLTNNGSGIFKLASTPGTSGNISFNPWLVVAADVNGDGKLDLITANFFGIYSNTLSVLTNNGSGGFMLASTPGTGSNPWFVTAADVNGDGKVDLVSANYGTNTLTVLTNNGSGVFVLASSPVVGNKPHAVVTADVNGDGKVDLISANFDDNSISVLFDPLVFNGSFVGNGAGLTGLNASNISSGTLADTRLSSNVALRAGGNNFTGSQSITAGSLGVGTTTPASPLTVQKNVSGGRGGEISIVNYSANSVGNEASLNFGVDASSYDSDNGNAQIKARLMNDFNAATDLIFNLWSGSSFNERLRISANGNVGIGTFNPQGTLHVSSSSSAPQIVISQQNPVEYSRLVMGVNGYPQWTLSVQPSATPQLLFWNGSANVAYLNYNGSFFAQSFTPLSDRNAKENFHPVSNKEVLDKVVSLQITAWNFKTDPGEKHIGPMAQDFYAAFGTGPDDKHIATVDADGVALAAIQGLNQKLEETRTENERLRARLDKLERLLTERK